MHMPLHLYNTLTRNKEKFEPIHPPFVGMYVCGPTVYNDVHLGNCRTFISFDILYRYLKFLGYQVRYVRNITDAGHLEGDADTGEDKISKRAKLEKLEPMQIVQKYTVGFHQIMDLFNVLPPDIEPTATGHILEQQEMAKKILENGFAYEVNGTIYFDVEKFSKLYNYTALTGRKLEELYENTRELDGQDEKKGRLDFALWIKAKPEHLMQWNSPWGKGFPGWHIECSAMSTKYLGEEFDIHGGGMDLAPTHHTNEIAQNIAYCGKSPARIWMHTNMLTVNGQKMSKSLGNSILPKELFTGNHPLLSKGYSPNVVRFFMLQSHYRSTLDISEPALQAAEKALQRLLEAYEKINTITPSATEQTEVIEKIRLGCEQAMNDDLNTAVMLSHLFELSKMLNAASDGKVSLGKNSLQLAKKIFDDYLIQICGIRTNEQQSSKTNETISKLMEIILEIRREAKEQKNYALSDRLRNKLSAAGIQIKDHKDGTSWNIL
ncbi:MAG: cysteine--tRNA ligase [Bacteroidia bacterium]|nr:cysteine--tRNA ligase [Bacteroidia bacterium]